MMSYLDIQLGDNKLSLKSLSPKEVSEEYVGWLNDPEVNQYLEVRHKLHTLATVTEYVASMFESKHSYLFGIYIENKHVGNIQLTITSTQYKVGAIGLMIGHKQYWGKGIGRAAIDLITNFAFETLELKKLEAGCYEANLGSLNAFLKCGYVVEGFLQCSIEFEGKRMGVFRMGKVAT